jgi:hypothetical protein
MRSKREGPTGPDLSVFKYTGSVLNEWELGKRLDRRTRFRSIGLVKPAATDLRPSPGRNIHPNVTLPDFGTDCFSNETVSLSRSMQ